MGGSDFGGGMGTAVDELEQDQDQDQTLEFLQVVPQIW